MASASPPISKTNREIFVKLLQCSCHIKGSSSPRTVISLADVFIKNNSKQELANLSSTGNTVLESENIPNINTSTNAVKLPKITLPDFDGKYENYPKFADIFNALINNNQTLKSLEVSESNYETAFKLIQERFENKKMIIHAHVKALFEMAPTRKENHQALRKLVDEYFKHVRALKNLGEPVDTWDTLLIYLINTKLDPESKRKWEEMSIKNKEMPKIDKFTDFLKGRCDLLETLAGVSDPNATKTLNNGNKAIPNYKRNVETRLVKLMQPPRKRIQFLILNKITQNIPNVTFDSSHLEIPELKLADPDFNTSGEIDILLGAGIFWELLCVGQLKIGETFVHKTKLGWVVAGHIPIYSLFTQKSTICNLSINTDIQESLEKFWNLEECQNNIKYYTPEERACEDSFTSRFKRDEGGRSIVALPLRENPSVLGDSLTIAVNRFLELEKRLDNNPPMKKAYSESIDEYQRLGHMTQIPETEISNAPNFYLPHHGVYKEHSLTIRLRVVFDASNFKPVLCIHCRQHSLDTFTPVTAHSTAMICLNVARRRDLQIFTRALLALAHVTGLTPLRNCCLSICWTTLFILWKSSLDRNVVGSHSIENSIRLRREVSKILSDAGFTLRKWSSNDSAILKNELKINNLPEYYITDDTCVKTLGLYWKSDSDVLHFAIDIGSKTERVTKRHILSTICKIFDPLGLLCPFIILAKIILQQLWRLKLQWDESVPIDLYTQIKKKKKKQS
ncbi:hypothetical protein NQ317_017034, partial [Molorchus minor]